MFSEKFGHGKVSNVSNTKLKIENNKLIATLIDPITQKPVSHHTYDQDAFITRYLETRTESYRDAKISNNRRILIQNKITISLKGHVNEREVFGSFSWDAEASLHKEFIKRLKRGHIRGVYSRLVYVQAYVDGGNFSSRKYSDIRDAFSVQCCGCLKDVDVWDARKIFDQICFDISRVFQGDLNHIESYKNEFTLICDRCGNRIKYALKITVDFPENGAGMIRAYRFWKSPMLEL